MIQHVVRVHVQHVSKKVAILLKVSAVETLPRFKNSNGVNSMFGSNC